MSDHLPAIPQDFSLADDPRKTEEMLPHEKEGRLEQNYRDWSRTAPASTVRKYAAGVAKLVKWLDGRGLPYDFPANAVHPRTLAQWVDDRSEGLGVASFKGYIAAINKMHVLAGYPPAGGALAVQNALKRLASEKTVKQRAAKPLQFDVLGPVLDQLDAAGDMMALRDAAVLCVAYDTMCRRSEVAALNVSDINSALSQYSVTVRRSKTDQLGEGDEKYLSPTSHARVTAWIEAARLSGDDPLFIPLSVVPSDTGADRLSGRDVARIIARRAGKGFTGHSTRRGAAQDQNDAGASLPQIMQAGGWASPAMVSKYLKGADVQRGAAALLAEKQGRV